MFFLKLLKLHDLANSHHLHRPERLLFLRVNKLSICQVLYITARICRVHEGQVLGQSPEPRSNGHKAWLHSSSKEEERVATTRKSKAERIKDHQAERALHLIRTSKKVNDEEDEGERRVRLRRLEEEADLKLAEDMLSICSGSDNSSDVPDVSSTLVDLGSISIFNPESRQDFQRLLKTLVPIISRNFQNPHYVAFLQEFLSQLAQDVPGEEIRKIISVLTRLSNQKAKEEKAIEKSCKRRGTQKGKT